jgi:hypothetical protein
MVGCAHADYGESEILYMRGGKITLSSVSCSFWIVQALSLRFEVVDRDVDVF